MVPAPPRAGDCGAANSSTRLSSNISTRRATSAIGPPSSSRLETLRRAFSRRSFSHTVVDILLAGNRSTTFAAYESAWNCWASASWCVERHKDPMSNALTSILEYLASLHLAGKSYSTINIHRSMLSTTLEPIKGVPIGQNRWVKNLLRGIYNLNPPQPRYRKMWDPDIVLNHMKLLDNESLNISTLSRKLATLLALTSLLRTAELASITSHILPIGSFLLSI